MNIEDDNVHPDEGLIHAWLDDALSGEGLSRIEAHVSSCAACGEIVAEARGLIAGASRVITMLDETPAKIVHVSPSAPAVVPPSRSAWTMLRVTPSRAAIAASLIVAVGVLMTQKRVATDSAVNKDVSATPSVVADAKPDSVLNSAIVEKLKREQPARVMSRSAQPAIPTPPASAPLAMDEIAPQRVAAARKSFDAQRDSIVPADRVRAGLAPSAGASAIQQTVTAAKVAENDVAGIAKGRVANVSSLSTARGCYRVESVQPGVQWGAAALPIVLSFDESGRLARVLQPNGVATDELTTATVASADSLVMNLRRIGYVGSIRLGGGGDAWTGTLRSAVDNFRLEEVVVTGTASATGAVDERRKDRAASPPASAPTTPPSAAATAKAMAPETAAAPIAVTARKVSCPAP